MKAMRNKIREVVRIGPQSPWYRLDIPSLREPKKVWTGVFVIVTTLLQDDHMRQFRPNAGGADVQA